MSENTAPAACTAEDWALARDVGLPFMTTADERAIAAFAAAIRAPMSATAQMAMDFTLLVERYFRDDAVEAATEEQIADALYALRAHIAKALGSAS